MAKSAIRLLDLRHVSIKTGDNNKMAVINTVAFVWAFHAGISIVIQSQIYFE